MKIAVSDVTNFPIAEKFHHTKTQPKEYGQRIQRPKRLIRRGMSNIPIFSITTSAENKVNVLE